MTAAWVLLGGALGAPTRYVVDLLVQSRHRTGWPWGTLTVNVAGSLLLGLLMGATPTTAVAAVVGTGFCGALTTFSTFSFETVRLAEEGRWSAATWYVGGSLLAGLVAVTLGWWLGGVLG